ncbi:unnamed protein product, partial [Meganyctiphanes norvegica]
RTCNSSMFINDSMDIIWGPMYTTYQILFPIFISIGILLNIGICAIMRKTTFQDYPINRYIMVISVLNIGYNIFLIPISSSNNGCIISSSSAATYYAHFGWAVSEGFLTARSYTIGAIAYDRLLAIYFQYYCYSNKDKNFKIFKCRTMGIVLLSILMTIPVTYFASFKTCTFNNSTKYIVTDFYR